MPAVSPKQAQLFRIALAKKNGAKIKGGGPAEKIAKSLTAKTLQEFTHQ